MKPSPSIRQHDLAVLAESRYIQYEIDVRESDDHCWYMTFTLAQGERPRFLVTTRGDLKNWRSVALAFGFLQENLPLCETVRFHINGWIFLKVPPARLLISPV